jgi:hypothetical protein
VHRACGGNEISKYLILNVKLVAEDGFEPPTRGL